MMPLSLMDAASSDNFSGSKCLRGWFSFGLISFISTRITVASTSSAFCDSLLASDEEVFSPTSFSLPGFSDPEVSAVAP